MKTSVITLHKLIALALMLSPLVGKAQEISASALEQISAFITERRSLAVRPSKK